MKSVRFFAVLCTLASLLLLASTAQANLIVTAVVPPMWDDPGTSAVESIPGVDPAFLAAPIVSNTSNVQLLADRPATAVHFYLYAYIDSAGINKLNGAQGNIVVNQGSGVKGSVTYAIPSLNGLLAAYGGSGFGDYPGIQDLNNDSFFDAGSPDFLYDGLPIASPVLTSPPWSASIVAKGNKNSLWGFYNSAGVEQGANATPNNAILIGGGTLLVSTLNSGTAASVSFNAYNLYGEGALWAQNGGTAQVDTPDTFLGGAPLTISCTGQDVPEPATFVLLGVAGLIGLVFVRKRK